jgi:hypothetical protein
MEKRTLPVRAEWCQVRCAYRARILSDAELGLFLIAPIFIALAGDEPRRPLDP